MAFEVEEEEHVAGEQQVTGPVLARRPAAQQQVLALLRGHPCRAQHDRTGGREVREVRQVRSVVRTCGGSAHGVLDDPDPRLRKTGTLQVLGHRVGHRDHQVAAAAQHPHGPGVVLRPEAVDGRHQGGPAGPGHRVGGEGGSDVVGVHDVHGSSRSPGQQPGRARRERDRTAGGQGHADVVDARDLRQQRHPPPPVAGDPGPVTAGGHPLREAEDDRLGAAGPQLGDDLQDPHRVRSARAVA